MDTKILNALSESVNNIKNLSDLSELEASVNEVITDRKEYLNRINEACMLSEKSFGCIKESFESISPALYNTNAGRAIMKEYINEVKNDKLLRNMYSIYENVYHAKEGSDAGYIVDEAFKTPFCKKDLTEGTRRLGMILAKAYITLGGHADAFVNENKELNESIDYLATTKKSLSNLSEISVKRSIVEKYINENAGKNVRFVPTTSTFETVMENFKQKYAGVEGIDLIAKVTASGSKEPVFEEYKKSCLDAIDKAIAENTNNVNVDRLNEIRSSLEAKVYDEDTINIDLANFIMLKETIEQ